MRYELDPIEYALRVYEDHSTNHVATALVRVYGDRAWLSNLSSPRLFQALPEHLLEFLDRLGVVALEGYMRPVMARAARMATRGHASFTVTHRGMCAGRELDWVVIGRLSEGV